MLELSFVGNRLVRLSAWSNGELCLSNGTSIHVGWAVLCMGWLQESMKEKLVQRLER